MHVRSALFNGNALSRRMLVHFLAGLLARLDLEGLDSSGHLPNLVPPFDPRQKHIEISIGKFAQGRGQL